MAIQAWYQVTQMDEKKWVCGHCGSSVAGNLGYYRNEQSPGSPINQTELKKQSVRRIVICPSCEHPTYLNGEQQTPGVAYGRAIKHLPPELDAVYTQARNCMSVGGYVPVVLAARTILMHIAVEQGAAEGQNFTDYVNHLVNGNFVPPGANKWVDHVRVKGNAATHRVALMGREDAERVLKFVEMILMFLYEYPNEA
jgi:hypothetical protein